MKASDGTHFSDVAEEVLTSISVPIIPDVDDYDGVAYILTVPPGAFGLKGCRLPFTEENGRRIEAWMKARGVDRAKGAQFVFRLEAGGSVSIAIRRTPRSEQ